MHYQNNVENVTERLKYHLHAMNEYDWQGKKDLYGRHKKLYNYYKDLHHKGVLYNPLF